MRWPGDFPALFAFLCMCLWSLLCVLDMLGRGLLQLQRAFHFICASNMSASEGEGFLFLVHTRAARLCEILSRMICSLIHISLGWMSLHLHLHVLSQALKAWFCSFAALFWFPFMCLLLLHNQISHAVFFLPCMLDALPGLLCSSTCISFWP